jgi:hypothetical protein
MRRATANREAFELVSDALFSLDRYKTEKELADLDAAQALLNRAQQLDPTYTRAKYIAALVEDLGGRPADASDQLQGVLAEGYTLAGEVRFNLAVAEYHQYHKENLERAERELRTLLEDNDTSAAIRLYASVLLVQIYAMRSLLEPLTPDVATAQAFYSRAISAFDQLPRWIRRATRSDRRAGHEVAWQAWSGYGAALMYATDYEQDKDLRLRLLRRSVDALNRADKLNPKDWIVYCNLGSAFMRLSRDADSPRDHKKATAYLTEVIGHLRPNYGFALYELGRLERVNRQYQTAIDYLSRSLSVEKRYRDVPAERVQREIDLANRQDPTYP